MGASPGLTRPAAATRQPTSTTTVGTADRTGQLSGGGTIQASRHPQAHRLRPISSPVLVGREAELEHLLALVTAPPAVALVVGEAGVGKTRLVAEMLGLPTLGDRRRLVGRCHPLRDPVPLAPVVDAVRGLGGLGSARALPPVTGALALLVPEIAAELPPPPPTTGDPRTDRHLLFRAVVELLARLGPTVLVLEDLHWADDTTGELLRYLVTGIPDQLSIVGTYRHEDLRPSSTIASLTHRLGPTVAAGTVAVAPLGPAQVRRLAAAILDAGTVSEAAGAELHARTGGIPFAVEEVVRLVADRPDVLGRGGTRVREALDALELPGAIRQPIVDRLAYLSRGARRLVEAAAVIGLPAGEHLLAGVAGLTGVRGTAALREALDSAVLFEMGGDRFGFRHSLASEAVYSAVAGPERRRLHLRAAEVVQGSDPGASATLARHYREAGRLAEWLRHAELAADAANAILDHEAAAALLRAALATPAAPASRPRLAVKLALSALSSATPPGDAVALLRAVLEDEALAPDVRGEVRALLGQLLVAAGDATAGYREQERSVRDLTWRPQLAVRIMLNLASPWVAEGREEEHRRWLRAASRSAESSDDPESLLAVRVAQALIPLYLGDPAAWEAARRLPRVATSPEEHRQLLWGAANLVGACFHLGHYGPARAFLDDAARLAGVIGWGPMLHVPATAAILLDWAEGRWSGLAERAHAHSEEMADFPGWAVDGELVVGGLALATGDLDAAEDRFEPSFATALAAGIIPGAAVATGGLARARLAAGDAPGAARAAEQGLEVIRRKGVWVWSAELVPPAVDALLATGRSAEATRLVDELAGGLGGRDAPLAEAALALCRGALADAEGDHRAAARAHRQASAAYAGLPRPHDAARAAFRQGSALLDAGDGGGAAVVLQSLAALETLGATADAGHVRRELRRRSVSVPRPITSGRRGYGNRLSPREAEVVAQAARGLTNVEIARMLFLSPRTVEHHVAAAMQKLGVESRRELRPPAGGQS